LPLGSGMPRRNRSFEIIAALPSGRSCTILVGTQRQLHDVQREIEKRLQVAACAQRLIFDNGNNIQEIYSWQLVGETGLAEGATLTVMHSWPTTADELLPALENVAEDSSRYTVLCADVVASCLDHEDPRVRIAALRALAWMGEVAAPHAQRVSELMVTAPPAPSRTGPKETASAAYALSWMGSAGAEHAASLLLRLGSFRTTHRSHDAARHTLRRAMESMCYAELPCARRTALAALLDLADRHFGIPLSDLAKSIPVDDRSGSWLLGAGYAPHYVQPVPVSIVTPYFCEIVLPTLAAACFDEDLGMQQRAADFILRCSRPSLIQREGPNCDFLSFFEAHQNIAATDWSRSLLAMHHSNAHLMQALLQFGWLDESTDDLVHKQEVVQVCRALEESLGDHWPSWKGWQESLEDSPPTKDDADVKQAVIRVRLAAVYLLRREMQQWASILSQHLQKTGGYDSEDDFGGYHYCQDGRMIQNYVYDVFEQNLQCLVSCGVSNDSAEVRKATVEALTKIAPRGRPCICAVGRLQKKEQNKEVHEAIQRFMAAYAGEILQSRGQLFSDRTYVQYGPNGFDDWGDEDDYDFLDEHEEPLMDKRGGFSKPHATRAARNHKQHGLNASSAPSVLACQKKKERRRQAFAADSQDYVASKRRGDLAVARGRQTKTILAEWW